MTKTSGYVRFLTIKMNPFFGFYQLGTGRDKDIKNIAHKKKSSLNRRLGKKKAPSRSPLQN